MMECDTSGRFLGLNYDDYQYLDESSSKKMRLDFDFLMMGDEPFSHIFERRIKTELDKSDYCESEELTTILINGVTETDPLDFVTASEDTDFTIKNEEDPIDISNNSNIDDDIDDDNNCNNNDITNKDNDSEDQSSFIVESCKIIQDDISCYMNLQEPLEHLRPVVEERTSLDLSDFSFSLQNYEKLDSSKNLIELVNHCVNGDGIVLYKLQLAIDSLGNKRIVVLDVIKPEEFHGVKQVNEVAQENDTIEADVPSDEIHAVRWRIDQNFKKEQERLKIPEDPNDWEKSHVRHWLLWAVRQFNVIGINLADWEIDGNTLCQLSPEDFKKKVPKDPGGLFWTHLELLKKCKYAAVIVQKQLNKSSCSTDNVIITKKVIVSRGINSIDKTKNANRMAKPRVKNKILQLRDNNSQVQCSNRSGNNGQIQLWQFLLELLTDKHHRQAIQWLGDDGEFKLLNPEMVAHLWGERKNKPTMNYEKLSRALRYYYEGDMISKVHGKRFVYKFVCDLKSLLGYSASELNLRVIEAEKKLIVDKESNSILFGSNENDYDFYN